MHAQPHAGAPRNGNGSPQRPSDGRPSASQPPPIPLGDGTGRGGQLAPDRLVVPVTPAPTKGFRKWMFAMSGGKVNPGRSRDEELMAALMDCIAQPLPGKLKVAILSGKGGIGKTTTTIGLGSVLAHFRRPHVAAIDFNPDQGTLGMRVPLSKDGTIRELIDYVQKYQGISPTTLESYINYNQHRLGIIRSGDDGISGSEISADQYRGVMTVLHEIFPLTLIDTGTSTVTNIYRSILDTVDQVVFVGSYSIDGAAIASKTMARIREEGGRCEELANNSIVVLTKPHVVSDRVDSHKILTHFRESTNTGAVHVSPWDAHLNEGGYFDLNQLSPKTNRAYMLLAADIVSLLAGKAPFTESIGQYGTHFPAT